ncbi:type VI secretion system tip protein VgrG [Pseudomonas sp. 148P]|uniref:Type VI secretion system tip protein VgrG n=1 Tax=Pseudomonas ulcerans TaxID=3115852 RepID=A0ABU7I0E2_9PSED|nr:MULTISPECIES: type VI secretion system tip protein VgrG [unclassified Pseudomonas]MEE1926019.1 type VI secretion system tip protein VgrG [Pseudomonas sp. 147P]MEE1937264.1 type VI secretion system tip protein VgrG [Pseudomonas sp. 148P]
MDTIVSRYPSPTTRNPYQLNVQNLDVPLDIFAFEGEEYLSQPFRYTIRFSCALPRPDAEDDDPDRPKPLDLDKALFLNRTARFALYGEPPVTYPWEEKKKKHNPVRELFGIITSFRRIRATVDEGQYEIVLEPRFGLLARSKQTRLYRRKSVPDIVKHILKERHKLFSHEYFFDLRRDYPVRDHVLQYEETDLAFVQRLLAEVGIWYRFAINSEHRVEVVHFRDWPFHDLKTELPYLPRAGMNSNGGDCVWDIGTRHQVVEKDLVFRTYDPRQANKHLQGETEQWRLGYSVYGETYEYGWAYTELGEIYSDRPTPETGRFFARLTYERNMNLRSQVTGFSSSPQMVPASMLKLSGDLPQDCQKTLIVHTTRVSGARNRNYLVEFEGLPFDGLVGFRPPLQPKPVIAGTIPARITSRQKNDPYSHIDLEGRYRVSFLFDRDTREPGYESLALRLARPYAGDLYGLHLPLLAGTEVAIAFEQGDPDRPYISHALHDDRHPDHVARDNNTRNVLRTPSNNKLRMEDKKGQEHIKVSTEFGGKSQLNLGHLVGKDRKKRGEGFELRSDHWGALRAGKGLFISADPQPKAQGDVLEMAPALDRLQQAAEQLEGLSRDAEASRGDPADVQAQLTLLKGDVEQLKSAVLLLSAPKGIALTSGDHLQLAAQNNLLLNAGGNADMSVVKRLFIGVGQGLSLFVRKLGIKLIANQGPVQIQAQHDTLTLMAREGLEVVSTEDEIRIVAKKKITLNAGGSYLILDPTRIEAGTEGDYLVKAPRVAFTGAASMSAAHPEYPVSQFKQALRFNINKTATAPRIGWAGMPYRLYAGSGLVGEGVLDKSGQVRVDHQVATHSYLLQLANGVEFRLPVPDQYSNPEQAHLANRGLQNHKSASNETVNQPATHKEHRTHYSALLDGSAASQEDNS